MPRRGLLTGENGGQNVASRPGLGAVLGSQSRRTGLCNDVTLAEIKVLGRLDCLKVNSPAGYPQAWIILCICGRKTLNRPNYPA
jgi:hypothetical protein